MTIIGVPEGKASVVSEMTGEDWVFELSWLDHDLHLDDFFDPVKQFFDSWSFQFFFCSLIGH